MSGRAWGGVPYIAVAKENAEQPWWSRSVLGRVNERIFLDQFHRSIFGPSGLWWENDRSKVAGFEREIALTTLGEVLSLNIAAPFPRNVFSMNRGGFGRPGGGFQGRR